MEINIEKFICDCIEKAERSVTWEYIDENIDGHIFKGALRKQGLEYKNGKIVKIGEEPKEAGKDKELTWEDIPKILHICEQLKTRWWFRGDDEQTKLIGTQVFWEEVLKQFKDLKQSK